MSADLKTQKAKEKFPLEATWTEAYQNAHVAAEITEKFFGGKPVSRHDLEWLRRVAADLLNAAEKLKLP